MRGTPHAAGHDGSCPVACIEFDREAYFPSRCAKAVPSGVGVVRQPDTSHRFPRCQRNHAEFEAARGDRAEAAIGGVVVQPPSDGTRGRRVWQGNTLPFRRDVHAGSLSIRSLYDAAVSCGAAERC